MIRFDKISGLPVHDDGNQQRILGALKPKFKSPLPSFGDKFTAIDESAWEECSIKPWNAPILNQGRHGSCVGHGSVTGFTYSWLFSGQQSFPFSPTYIYAWINGGVDRGSVVGDGLKELKERGTCFISQFGEDSLFTNQMSEEAKTTASRFRVLDAFKINSWIELGTALMLGFPVVCGLAVGNNFSHLDSNGVAPLPDVVAGGHCLCNTGLKKINGEWVLETQNSWGELWGMNGFCYLHRDHFSPRYHFPFDVFAVASVQDDPITEDEDPPVTEE